MMHAVASKRRLINVISLSFVSKLFSKKFLIKHQYNLRNDRLPSIKAKTERFRNSFIPYAIRTYS